MPKPFEECSAPSRRDEAPMGRIEIRNPGYASATPEDAAHAPLRPTSSRGERNRNR